MIVVTLATSEYAGKSRELLNTLDRGLPKGKLDSIAESASVNLFFQHGGQI